VWTLLSFIEYYIFFCIMRAPLRRESERKENHAGPLLLPSEQHTYPKIFSDQPLPLHIASPPA